MQIESFYVQVHAQTVETKTKLLSSAHIEVDELVELPKRHKAWNNYLPDNEACNSQAGRHTRTHPRREAGL